MYQLMKFLSLKRSMADILDLAAIMEQKVCLSLKYEKAHPDAPLRKMSCLYDKMLLLFQTNY